MDRRGRLSYVASAIDILQKVTTLIFPTPVGGIKKDGKTRSHQALRVNS